MQKDYEGYVICHYANNLMQGLKYSPKTSDIFVDWLEENDYSIDFINFIDEHDFEDKKIRRLVHPRHHRKRTFIRNKKITINKWQEIKFFYNQNFLNMKKPAIGTLEKNINAIAKEVCFDKNSLELLRFAIRVSLDRDFSSLVENTLKSSKLSLESFICVVLGIKNSNINNIRKAMNTLSVAGIIQPERSRYSDIVENTINIREAFLRSLLPPNNSKSDIYQNLFGKTAKATLLWQDFEHIAEERDLVFDVLNGAYEKPEKGINILLYGPPGTGKTEFSKTLANKLKKNLFIIGEEDENSEEPTRSDRISSLNLANKLLSKNNKAMLMFDEMEDIVCSPYERTFGSKVFLNRLFENNQIPTIWICNDIYRFKQAMLRRFTLAVEMKTPPKENVYKIWKRVLKKHKISLPEKDIKDLAKNLDVAPSLAENAAKVARLSKRSGKEGLKLVAKGIKKAMNGGREKTEETHFDNKNYNPKLENTDTPLALLTEQILKGANISKGFSLCLYGSAGTGKSAYVRYLADKMGLEILQKRTSDLISMWVGEAEKNIADAFREATEKKAFLVFDEADSLLADRTGATKSWEVSQVNEMLTWMESHKLPFACTTNLMQNLDKASLRRFVFKVKYDFMTNEQCKLAYRVFFKKEIKGNVFFPDNLAPGDFAVVFKKAEILGLIDNQKEILNFLKIESDAKDTNRSKTPIGFCR